MHSKILKSIGPHSNNSNLITIGYCIEPPKEVLKHVLEQGYRIGGYRQAGETRCFGEGLVIRGTDMEPIDLGLEVTGRLTQIPFSKYDLRLDEITEENLKWMFGNEGGNLRVYNPNLQPCIQNIFRIPEKYIENKHRIIMDSAKEFVETVKGQPVTLEYLMSLSK